MLDSSAAHAPSMPPAASSAAVASRAACSHRSPQPRAHAITTADGFPAPYARVGNTPVWVVADVAAWFAASGRTWTPPTQTNASADDGHAWRPRRSQMAWPCAVRERHVGTR